MVREGISEALVGHPDETVGVWGKLRSLRVPLITIENLGNRLALVWS
jgi:hypothetical protein